MIPRGKSSRPRSVSGPQFVCYHGQIIRLSPEQWQRLRPMIYRKPAEEAAAIGQEFLIQEGLI